MPWRGEASWQGGALNNLAVAAASSSSLNLNVTCFVVFLLIFYGCTFAVFGFFGKNPAGAHVMGTVAYFSNGNGAEGWEWKHLVVQAGLKSSKKVSWLKT